MTGILCEKGILCAFLDELLGHLRRQVDGGRAHALLHCHCGDAGIVLMNMAAKIFVAADEYRGYAQGCAHIGVHEKFRSQPAVEFNVICLAVHGVGQGAAVGTGRRVVSHEHKGVKAPVQTADHGIRGVLPA